MEIAAACIAQLVPCMSPSVARHWDNHRSVYKNMDRLRKSYEELNCRKTDIESRLVTDHIEGETELKSEVKNWLESVEKISPEVEGIEAKVRIVKFFSRAGLGKIVNLKIKEVVEILSKGVFPDGLVIQLPRRGYEKPTTSILGGETTFQRKMEEIWAFLLDDEVAKIGVYGMGGIGKTTALEHTHNRLLKDRKDDFRTVIWVTVSKDCSIIYLQDMLAKKLNLDLSKDGDVETRAESLYRELKKKMNFALILDDLWEEYCLKEIGIPEPTKENGCKIVITTRSREVCCRMSCNQIIKMECLSDREALKLFKDVVGINAMNVLNLDAIMKDVVGECAGLPLAIVVVAGSLKGVVDIDEWEIALEELREYSNAESPYDQIFDRLKFSYDRLNDKTLQACLLYCALYPEDYQIERELLVEHLVAEGIIEERKTRKSQIRRGNAMLNKLVNACLLNDIHNLSKEKCVIMHDLVRDMALKITSGSPRYLVRSGVGLRCVPDEGSWDDDVVKVSLMNNVNLSSIPSDIKPKKCLRLSTLLLQRNRYLKEISNNFFLHMRLLSVLDLSYTGIKQLPPSISDLTALTALFLRSCDTLRNVPSLAKLTNLRLLDLYRSPIDQVPHGLEMLTKLRYLNLSYLILPTGILCNLVDLQYLSHISNPNIQKLKFEDLENLRKLEFIGAALHDLVSWNAFVRSWEARRLTSYVLQLGSDGTVRSDFRQNEKVIYLYNFSVRGYATSSECPLLLPEDVEILHISGCNLNVDSLCEIASFSHVTKLRSCFVTMVDKIKHVFAYCSPCIIPLLQNLEYLSVTNLKNFEGLIRGNGGIPSPLPHRVFSSLKHLDIICCIKMNKLCLMSLLPNLEELVIESCEMLMEILCEGDSVCSDDGNGERGKGQMIKMITLPKLKSLTLKRLPNLLSLPLIADSVERIEISGCEKLRNLPIIDREPIPSSLKDVTLGRETWSVLEWDHPDAKNFVQSVLDYDINRSM